jgi:hypothetical protein
MKVIARITAWLRAYCAWSVLPLPPIVVPVATFHLMSSRSRAPREPLRELRRRGRDFS